MSNEHKSKCNRNWHSGSVVKSLLGMFQDPIWTLIHVLAAPFPSQLPLWPGKEVEDGPKPTIEVPQYLIVKKKMVQGIGSHWQIRAGSQKVDFLEVSATVKGKQKDDVLQ